MPATHMVFYGTLMSAFPTQTRLGLAGRLTCLGPCVAPGRMYDVGAYPALKPEAGEIRGELWRLDDPEALPVLDAFEGVNPQDPAKGEYTRQMVALSQPQGQQAWIYYYNGDVSRHPAVEPGDWPAHVARRGGFDFEGFFHSRT